MSFLPVPVTDFRCISLLPLSAGKPILQTITKTKTYARETQIKNAHHVSIACARPGAGRRSPPARSAGGAAANAFPGFKHCRCAEAAPGGDQSIDFLEQAGGLRTSSLKASQSCRALLIPRKRWSWGCREPCPAVGARGMQAAAARAVHH